MAYADGFVIPVPKSNLAAYRRMARQAGKIWREHGALEYRECVGDDLDIPARFTPFPKMCKLKADEVVIFAWILYESKAHRNRVNKKVLSDPRLQAPALLPFDSRRMAFGGFKLLVDA